MIMSASKQTFTCKNGLSVWVRPLQPDDAPHLIDLFDHMGPDSRYARFHQPADNPSPSQIEAALKQLTQIDHERDAALIAFADLPDQPGAPVAVARYGGLEPGVAEAALVVRDDLQRNGIGSHMARLLLETAHAAGIRKLVATMQRGNSGALKVLQRLGYPVSKYPDGAMLNVELYLDRGS